MKTTITPGQIIKTRSIGDSDCIFTIEILSRLKSFATVKIEGQAEPVRCKVYEHDGREYVMAFGRYSMAPAFYAPEPAEEKLICKCSQLFVSEGYIGCRPEKCARGIV